MQKKIPKKRPETYIFRTSSPRPLFWQSLGKSVFSILHDLSSSLQQTALKNALETLFNLLKHSFEVRFNINIHRVPSGRRYTFAFLSFAEEGKAT